LNSISIFQLGKPIVWNYLHITLYRIKIAFMIRVKSPHSQPFHEKLIFRKLSFLVVAISIGFCACSKENYSEQPLPPDNQTESSAPDIYLAGSIGDGIHPKATYWKNGNAVILTDGTNYAEANSIVASGEDVFVAGYEYNGAYYVAKYWKNGKAVSLSDGTSPAIAYSITLAGNDVYVAGYEGNGTNGIAKYWKNGTAVSLTDGTNNATAYSIVVAGDDVYVAGDEYNGTNYVAKYWKNGKSLALTDGTKEAHAYSIAVSGTDVYVAGSEISGTNGNMVADYWKNGTVFHLTDGSNYARSNSITVSENSVYAAGAEFKDGNFFVAKYWLNGFPMAITDSSNYSMANSIVVVDHDIYIAGKELQGPFMQGEPVALYWKNGSEVTVQNPSDSGGWTNSVFVYENKSQGNEKNSYGEYYHSYEQEYVSTMSFQNETQEKHRGTKSSGGMFSFFGKHSKNRPSRNTTTEKNVFKFPEIRFPNLFQNHERNSIVRFKLK
jgi:hypothetical protein